MTRRKAIAGTAVYIGTCALFAVALDRFPNTTLATASVFVVYNTFRQAGEKQPVEQP